MKLTLGTGSIAGNAFAIDGLFAWWTAPDAGADVFDQMLGTVFHTRSTVSVFAFWIVFPRVGDRIVTDHWRTLLLAHPVVVEVLARQAIRLLGPDTPSSAEKVTAFARVGSETSSLMTLGRAVDF